MHSMLWKNPSGACQMLHKYLVSIVSITHYLYSSLYCASLKWMFYEATCPLLLMRSHLGYCIQVCMHRLIKETIFISKNFQQKSLVLSRKADGCLFDQIPLTFSSERRDSHPFGQSPHEPHLRAVVEKQHAACHRARRSRVGVPTPCPPTPLPHLITVGRTGMFTWQGLKSQ